MAHIELDSFVKNFAETLDETDISTITAETEFRGIEEWSSLTALTLIAMVDEMYEVKITGDEIKSSNTVKDLFEIVKAKL